MTIQQILDAILGQLGVLVLLLLILFGGWKRWWVFGTYYTEMQTELRGQLSKLEHRLERAEHFAETGTNLANRATRLAEHHRTEVPGE